MVKGIHYDGESKYLSALFAERITLAIVFESMRTEERTQLQSSEIGPVACETKALRMFLVTERVFPNIPVLALLVKLEILSEEKCVTDW